MIHKIQVGNIEVDVIQKGIRNMHLGVYPPAGRVRLSTPVNVKEDALRLFIVSKLSWIKKQQKKFQEQDRLPAHEYISRESHYFKGRRYLLGVIESDSTPHVTLRNKTYIDMHVRKGTIILQRQQLMHDWYRTELKKEIPSLIEKWQPIVGVHVNEWGVKLMKTKWGSCSINSRRIWINLELAKKPNHCLEYIVVHELVHLLERHHNDRFVALMGRFMPKWRHYKDELNRLPVSHAEWGY